MCKNTGSSLSHLNLFSHVHVYMYVPTCMYNQSRRMSKGSGWGRESFDILDAIL
jgi:hypothetical protein